MEDLSAVSSKSRRKSLTQFIPKNNIAYNPYNNGHHHSNNNKNHSEHKSPTEVPTLTTSSMASRSSPQHNSKPAFYVKRQKKNNMNHISKPNTNMNGYHTSPEYENENENDNDTETETETETESYDGLKNVNGYLSDGSALKNKNKNKHKNKRAKKRIKSYKRTFLPNKPPQAIHSNHHHHKYKNKGGPILDYDRFSKLKKKKKKYRKDPEKKRHSVGHCDSSTLGILKNKHSEKKHSKKASKKELKQLRWTHRATSIEHEHGHKLHNDTMANSNNTHTTKTNRNTHRRRSIFNKNEKVKHSNLKILDVESDDENMNMNVSSTNIRDKIKNIETEQEFYCELNSADYTKQDIIELCWDLLRSKDRSDELLQMINLMNSDLDIHKMMNTIKQTLNCKFTSLYTIESESLYLKCLCTSDGPVEEDIFISITSSTQLPARVYTKNSCIIRSVTENSQQICPDFNGFGNVYILGVPILRQDGTKIGVLCCYRDRSKCDQFDDSDLYSAKMLTSICSTTLKNISLFNEANEKEKQSQKILSIIDEMSGDVSEGYRHIIRKLVRKIRSLVVCTHIDFWTVDRSISSCSKLKCEVSHNQSLQDLIIDRNMSNILGQCAITGKYIKIDNSRMDKRYSKQQLQFCKGQSILIIPVRVENEIEPIAVIVAINKLPKKISTLATSTHKKIIKCIPFTNQDRRMLETFATSSSIIIKNSLLFQKINGLNRKHESMVCILRALQQKHNVIHMLSEATLAVRDALEAERVSLWFEDGQGNLDALDIGQIDANEEHNDQFESLQSVFVAIARYCAEDKMLINTPNVFEDEELWNVITDFIEFKDINNLNENQWFLRRACSVLCVPILSNGDTVVGVIQAIYKKGASFSETDLQIVESVSSEVAHTIARNISDLTLQKYVDKHDDIPLDVIEYYLTGGMEQEQQPQAKQQQQAAQPQHVNQEEKEEMEMRLQLYHNNVNIDRFVLDDKLKSYCDLLPTCDFDATQFDIQHDLEQFVLFAVAEYGLIDEFKLNMSKFKKFVHSIAKLYRNNPFHNWQHGFFVFHFVLYFITKQENIINILNNKQIFAILIAAMCHDVDHPGNDNLYEIEADSDLARIYNGLSVLENHHTYTTLALLRKNDLNFFIGSNLNKKDIKEIKKIITKSIMSTDMSHHNETIGILNDFITQKIIDINTGNINAKNKNEIKLKLCQCIVHLADLSAQTYPWRIAKEWERRIAKEFKQQTIKENKLDIPVRDWMAKTDLTTRYKNQFFFVTHVVKPLWEPAALLFAEMEERLATLKANSQKYIEIAKKKEKD